MIFPKLANYSGLDFFAKITISAKVGTNGSVSIRLEAGIIMQRVFICKQHERKVTVMQLTKHAGNEPFRRLVCANGSGCKNSFKNIFAINGKRDWDNFTVQKCVFIGYL